MDPTQLSAAASSRAIAAGTLSPVALAEAYLDRIAALDNQLHSFVLVLRDEAIAAAREAECDIRAGRSKGPLHGVPIGLKDIYQTKGIRTTAGSRRYLDHVPDADAETWVRLRNAGMILLGKNAMLELAYGEEHPDYGATRNPWDIEYGTNGSSSGSAAAVAAGLGYGSLGSDTGGSIRLPAAWCGIVGLKPTYGRVSRRGVFPLSYSLDHCGPLTRTVEDCALMMQALAGHDPLDPASADVPVPDYAASLDRRLDGMRIGVIRHWHERDAVAGFGAGNEPSAAYVAAFDAGCRTLERLGARLVDLRVPPLLDYADANRVILLAEAYALHETDFQKRPELFGRHCFARLALGAFLSAADYVEAVRRRRELCEATASALAGVDLIVSANATGPAPRIDQVGTYATFERPSYTAPYNLTGLPALSVPIGFENDLPLAFQIAGKPFGEAAVLHAGFAFEQASGLFERQPPIAASLPGR